MKNISCQTNTALITEIPHMVLYKKRVELSSSPPCTQTLGSVLGEVSKKEWKNEDCSSGCSSPDDGWILLCWEQERFGC
ncbi:hypothetical protein MANES_04G017601v8 [Manihot esculenta]|uniref:Uncharacterized protein n=1 Tax=Manihot esculenta TaxID=3983 RepID=A0ACB7HR09_MANES|nr:hypothetical protein MANES_04G017601v8 [Manihot esculenta]